MLLRHLVKRLSDITSRLLYARYDRRRSYKKVRESNSEIIIILQTGFAGQNPPADMMKELNIQTILIKQKGLED